MKIKDFKNEIKVLDIAALTQKAKTIRAETDDLILDKNMSKLKDLKAIYKKKKELARILTVLSQKKMIAKLESKEPVSAKTKVDKEGGKKNGR